MERKREFYPMITNTMSNALQLVNPLDMWDIVGVICTYPNHKLNSDLATNPIIDIILGELDRQYARWQRGNK